MNAYPSAPCSACIVGNGHVDGSIGFAEQLPYGRCAAVTDGGAPIAENGRAAGRIAFASHHTCSTAARQDRSHAATLKRDRAMADRVDTLVDPV